MPIRPEIISALHKLRFTRFLNTRMLPVPPKGTCRWCGEKAKWVYCSSECRQEVYVRMGYVDEYLFKRDKGFCIKCGIDTTWLFGHVYKIIVMWRRYRSRMPCSYSEFIKGFGPWWSDPLKRLWEAHHIVPVSKGGGCCGLENYQTICLRCHKEETAKMRGQVCQRTITKKERKK